MFGYYLNKKQRGEVGIVHSSACGCVDKMLYGQYIGKFSSMREALDFLNRQGIPVRPCSYCGLHDQ